MSSFSFRSNRAPAGWRSFTLVEMLVSLAVFSFIMVVLAQMAGLVDSAWLQGVGRVDNFTRARALLDMAAQDVQHGVFRPDLPAFASSSSYGTNADGAMALANSGDSTNAFYTRRPGLGTDVRDVSLVVYSLAFSSTNAILERADYPIPWSAPTSGWSEYFPFQSSLGPVISSATDQNTANGVVGFEMVFRRADGSTTNFYSGYESTNAVTAVGIGVAVIDAQTMKMLTAQQLSQIHGTLATALTGTNSIKADWDEALNTSFNYGSYPQPMKTGLKTFERYVTCKPGF